MHVRYNLSSIRCVPFCIEETSDVVLLSAQPSVRCGTKQYMRPETSVSHEFTKSFPVLVQRVKTLHNPYTLSFSEKRVNRFLTKLNDLIEIIEKDYFLDQERFQLLLESHWIQSRASAGSVLLPTWDLYMFKALESKTLAKDKEAYRALLAVTAEIRH
jgi:hypothetical protein